MPGTPRLSFHAPVKLAVLLAGLAALIAVSCAPSGAPPSFPVKQEGGLAVQVVDSNNDVGRTPSIALDSQGDPVVAYQLLTQVPKAGVLPVPVVAGAAQPPSIMLATQAGGIWTRTPVTGGGGLGKAIGNAPEIANKDHEAIPGVTTSMAVDAQGKHHVVWSTPSGLFYSDDTTGGFSTPEKISTAQVFGGSIALGSDGTVWVSYYEAGAVKAASGSSGNWRVENVASVSGAPGLPSVVTAIRVGSNGPVIAYGDNGATIATTRSGASWTSASIPGQGGYGVSLALDKDGLPEVAYYDAGGGVHEAAGIGGGSFRVTDVAQTGPSRSGQGDASWGTGIGVDDNGTVYLTWADLKANAVFLANNVQSSFSAQPIPQSLGGATPSLAAAADGKVLAVAWYDSVSGNLEVATTSHGQALAFSPQPVSPQPGPSATASCQPSGSTTLQIAAPNGAQATGFDTKCLAVKSNTAFTVDFRNNDTTIHNFEIYKSQSAVASPTGRLGGATGPTDLVQSGASASYKVSALPAGTYYFQCDVHPTTMNGAFVVAGT